MAEGAHASAALRLAATISLGLTALAFPPLPVCDAWVVLVGGLDIFSWFITRDQFLGRPITPASMDDHFGKPINPAGCSLPRIAGHRRTRPPGANLLEPSRPPAFEPRSRAP